MTMTPPYTDTPLRLRRSEIGSFRTPPITPVINDDEAERREARRQTASEWGTPAVAIEDSETLKSCLQICNDNKLSKENAWGVSVIDTLSSLMSKHHKTLSNFKVAGSSLEASSKVYALRVDSVHSEVVRMSSGLNRKVISENDDEEGDANRQNEGQTGDTAPNNQESTPRPKKRTRKLVSTITKNKDTINARLDTNPFTDPIFAKLNSTVGNISGSNRLLQNVLHSVDSELRLRMDDPFWNSVPYEPLAYPADEKGHDYSESEYVLAELFATIKLDGTLLRPHYSGYRITDTPAEQDDDDQPPIADDVDNMTSTQMAHAFDINAEIEDAQPDMHAYIDMEEGDFEDLTAEERIAVNNCKGLRRAPVVIEDMRPIDSTSTTLEYSYRPLDKISQFWAGPSHWKFKKPRNVSLSLAQRNSVQVPGENSKKVGLKSKRKTRSQPLQFPLEEVDDDLFQPLDENKIRKVNIQNWDAKKLKLPTDLQIDKNIFDVFHYAPGIPVTEEFEQRISSDLLPDDGSSYDYDHPLDDGGDIPKDDTDTERDVPESQQDQDVMSQTVMEIATNFVGAPDKVTKIIVPFAKRAKVIDMKQLKKSCMSLIDQQLCETNKENLPEKGILSDEKYKPGQATFNKIYAGLPKLLTPTMNDAVSPAIAFYSILHLANESNLRLVSNEQMSDFQIRKLDE